MLLFVLFSFIVCEKEPCLYFLFISSIYRIIIGLFVDDIIISYHKSINHEWLILKQNLLSKYQTSDLGTAQHVLGMRFIQSSTSISLDQHRYISDKIKEYNLQQSKHFSTPASLSLALLINLFLIMLLTIAKFCRLTHVCINYYSSRYHTCYEHPHSFHVFSSTTSSHCSQTCSSLS